MKKLIIKIILAVLLSLILVPLAHAYSIDSSFAPENSPFTRIPEATDAKTRTTWILQMISGALLFFAAPIAVIMIAINGFTLIVQGAESDKLDESKKNLTWSIGGLIIIILSWSAVKAIITITFKAADATSG